MFYRTARAVICLEVFCNFNIKCQRHTSESFQARRVLHTMQTHSVKFLSYRKTPNVQNNGCELCGRNRTFTFKTRQRLSYCNKKLIASHACPHKLQYWDKYCDRFSSSCFPLNRLMISSITKNFLYNYLITTGNHTTKSLSCFTLKKKLYKDYIQSLEDKYQSLLGLKESDLPTYVQKDFTELERLKPIVEVFQQVKQKYEDLEELESLAKGIACTCNY